MNSKLIISALGLVAMLATPAMAQRAPRHAMTPPAAAYMHQGYGEMPRGGLYFDGHYLGTDPDPSIRSEILRDYPSAIGAD